MDNLEEELGRRVFSENVAKRAPRRILSNVFLEKLGEKKLSADRIDIAPSINELGSICDKAAKNRQGPFYGWAVITVEKASLNGRKVSTSPKIDNPYHADIILPDAAVKKREEQKVHAQQLADSANWRKRP